MNLVQPLATGVNGAANGTVDIFKRGTSTYAQVFTTYQGDGATTPSAALTLDANGGRVVFVNEEVDIVVKDSTGVVLRSTNPMLTATDVEVRSSSFTGTDYTTAATGVNKPITLSDVLDLWTTNAGVPDWKVSFNGVTTTLFSAFSQLSGLFFNVKASIYGARGDGSQDDGSAIAAAVGAAVAAGGGIVYFPGGTYRITGALSMSPGVSFLGAGAKASTISVDHATSNGITVSAGTSNLSVSIRGLTVQPAQSNSGKMVVVEAGTVCNVQDCTIGGSNSTGYGISFDSASTRLTCIGNTFVLGGPVANGVYNDTGTPTCLILGNRFIGPASMTGNMMRANGGQSVIVGNVFDCSGTSAGAGACVVAATSYVVAANRFIAPTGGTITPISTVGTTGGNFVGLNSRAQSAFWTVSGVASAAASQLTHEGGDELDRAVRQYKTTDNTSPVSVDAGVYGTAEVRRTNNSNQTINVTTPNSGGQFFTLVLNNDQAGVSGTITLGSPFKGQAPFTVAANNVRSLVFRSYENMAAGGASATKYWGFVGSTGDVTP